jgi:hypothetical protein
MTSIRRGGRRGPGRPKLKTVPYKQRQIATTAKSQSGQKRGLAPTRRVDSSPDLIDIDPLSDTDTDSDVDSNYDHDSDFSNLNL